MVVNNVHDYSDSAVMESLNHLLNLVDTNVTVVRIRGISSVRNVVVLRIVTPVTNLGGVAVDFVNLVIISERKKLNSVDVVLNKIVDTS